MTPTLNTIWEIVGALILIWVVSRGFEIVGAVLSSIQATLRRSAAANELTALYTREMCWRLHDSQGVRNGRGELMKWQDPAEDYLSARPILSEEHATMWVDRKRMREKFNGPDLAYHPDTDIGPEAEAIKARMAKWEAEFRDRWKKPTEP